MQLQASLTDPSLVGMVRDATGESIVVWSNGEITRGALRARIARCSDAATALSLCALLEDAHPYAHGTVVHAFFRALALRPLMQPVSDNAQQDLLDHAMELIPTSLSRSERAVSRQTLQLRR